MKKRLLALLLLTLMLANTILLTACGKDNGPAPEVNAGDIAYNGEEVTIKFVHTMGANLQEILDEYIIEFNKIYPNIHV